jgi:hypothetical protein
MLDLDELEARIAEGEKRNFFVAPLVKQLIAELRERREQVDGYRMMIDGLENAAHEERAAVVAWLRAECGSPGHEDRFCAYCNVRRNIAADIERGEHRREEKP